MVRMSAGSFLPDERVVDVAPRFTPRVGEPFVRRLNFVAGRSLTADALNLERRFWDTQTALLGRAVNAGIIEGLALELLDGDPGTSKIRLTPGSGMTDLGENVALSRALTARLVDIPAAEPLLEGSVSPFGLVGLFLKPVRAIAANFFDPEDPCPVDPEAYVYSDLVTQDAVQLVWARLDRGEPVTVPKPADRPRPVRPVNITGSKRALLGPLSSTNVLLPPAPALGQPAPQLIPTSIYRGMVAHRLLEEENAARRRGSRPHWAKHGLPVGILQVDPAGQVLFVDRFAITRAGGAVREPAMGSRLGVAPSLRRARFDQFLDHLQALRGEGADLSPATQFFRMLPPVGILPASVLDRSSLKSSALGEVSFKCGFFPANYVMEAAPIQLAQMESILAARSGLAPFDLGRRDYVQILVPVPDHLFHPRLLIQEKIADDFKNAIDKATVREGKFRAELSELQSVEPYVSALLDVSKASGKRVSNITEASVADGLRDKSVDILKELEKRFDAVPLTSNEKKELAPSAFEAAAAQISAGTKPVGDFLGLRPIVERLAQKIDTGNDQADMGFLRLQSDIFRLRKQMVGESDATRLATSPVLANLAATTTGLESGKLFSEMTKDLPKPATQLKFTAAALPQAATASVASAASAASAAGTTQKAAMATASKYVMATIDTTFLASNSFSNVMAGSFGKTFTPIEPAFTMAAAESPTKFADMGMAGIRMNLQDNIIQARDIAWQSLVYGKSSPIRTATIAERLRPSPAQEAKNSAVATKADIVRSMQDLGLNLAGLLLPVSASRVTLIPKAARDAAIGTLANTGAGAAVKILLGDANAMPIAEGDICVLSDKHLLKNTLLQFPHTGAAAATNIEIYKKMQEVTASLYSQRLALDNSRLASLILSDRLDPDPDDPDEADYFAAAVNALESAVSILRLFEGRLQSYAAFLDAARKALLQAFELAEQWQGMIDEANADIAEARHDFAVATALKVEEQARLDAINAQRRDILDKHVDIIAFARPMTVDRLRTAPGLKLFRPLTELLPACIESDAELPDEIEEILDAMNDVPVGWYPEVAKDLDGLTRPEHYYSAWQRGLDRSAIWLARNMESTPRIAYSGAQARVAGKASTGVYQALSGLLAQRKTILQNRGRRTMESLNGVSWTSLRQAALSELSIEDLEQGGKAGRDAARKGAQMLRQIGAVANCMLAGLRKVPGELRLIWADQLSEHDQAIDLLDTGAIPGWSSIELAERRELDVMHAWLFGRIDQTNEQARAMMSTLVRVCLLMASHAPVSAIVEGTIIDTRNVGPGESFEVDIGLGRAQIGMVATIGSGSLLHRGIIEDIVGTRVRVRLSDVDGPRVAVSANASIAFSAPVAVRLANVGF